MPAPQDKKIDNKLQATSMALRGADNALQFIRFRDELKKFQKPSGASNFKALRKAARGSGVLTGVAAAADIADLALNKETREKAAADVEHSAVNDGAVTRMVKGYLDPARTAYGIGKMVGDLMESTAAAKEAAKGLPSEAEYDARNRAAREKYLKRKADEAKRKEQEMNFLDAVERRTKNLA
jgi:hypothetical protein